MSSCAMTTHIIYVLSSAPGGSILQVIYMHAPSVASLSTPAHAIAFGGRLSEAISIYIFHIAPVAIAPYKSHAMCTPAIRRIVGFTAIAAIAAVSFDAAHLSTNSYAVAL
eukprot:4886178-Pleurochrysis_carterae.AAC.1